jgi:hypothetical protein
MSTVSESLPPALDFGFCPIHEASTHTIRLFNPSRKQSVSISLVNDSPFTVSPERGTLGLRGHLDIKVAIVPEAAQVIVATVIFDIEGEGQRVLKLSAIGKFSYVTLNRELFNFGQLLVASSDSKDLIIKNQSQVFTTFHITEAQERLPTHSDFRDSAFSFDHLSGTIPPNASYLVKVKFTPTIVGMFSARNYVLTTESGNSQQFGCIGYSLGVDVFFSSKVCNFGEVRGDTSTSRQVTLHNQSTVPVSYSLYTDHSGAFRFKRLTGSVNSKSTVKFLVYFSPMEPLSYYQRVFCVVRDHTLLYLDLFGSSYDILSRPMPLAQKDIEEFRTHVMMGTLDRLVEGRASSEYSYEESNQIALHKELMQSLQHQALAFSEEHFDFAFCPEGKVSEARVLTITNTTEYEWTVFWLLPGTNLPSDPDFCFDVQPVTAVLLSGQSVEFKVNFRPTEPATYYFSRVKLQAFLKTVGFIEGSDSLGRIETSLSVSLTGGLGKKSTRVVSSVVPPVTLELPCVGHSFPTNSQPFIPIVNTSRSRVLFPPCAPGDSAYQSVQINNLGDTPCYYRVLPDPAQVFRVFPPAGFVLGKTSIVLTLEFNPKVPMTYQYPIHCLLNHASSSGLSLTLIGLCCEPSLYLENHAKLYYPPLFTGVTSKQVIALVNSSQVPVEYTIDIPQKFSRELSVEPSIGSLHPHERVNVEMSFTPLKELEYRFNVPIKVARVIDTQQDANYVGYFRPGSGKFMHKVKQDPLEKFYAITIFGQGGRGSIDMMPRAIDFETVSIGFSAVKSFTLSNVSDCAILVRLAIVSKDTRLRNDPATTELIKSSFSFDFEEGILAANSNHKVSLRFVPDCRSESEYFVTCYSRQCLDGIRMKESPLSVETQIAVKAHGDFPVITITDLRTTTVSTATMWTQFNLSDTIKAVLSPLTQLEIRYNNSEIALTQAQEKLSNFEWDFGKVCMAGKRESLKAVLTVKNIGGVQATFKFVLPSDNELEMEAWADPGDPTSDEAFEKYILDNRIFTISPREARLECGQSFDVELAYNPPEVGQHYLNILFQIIHGKPVVLKLKGECLPAKRGFVQLPLKKYVFDPLPIGLRIGVTQSVPLKNFGTGKAHYEVDVAALMEFNRQNYSFPVFEVQNPTGRLGPKEQIYLYLTFKPLESIEYNFDLLINIKESSGDTQTLKLALTGQGYHSRVQAVPQSPTLFVGLPLFRCSFASHCSSAGFSVEEVDFGQVRPHTSVNRLAIMYNRSTASELRFKFKSTGLDFNDHLVVEPSAGIIGAESHCTLRLSLKPSDFPTTFEGEIEFELDWDVVAMNSQTSKQQLKRSIDIKSEPSASTELLFLRIKKRAFVDEEAQYSEFGNTEAELVKGILKEGIQTVLSDCTSYTLLRQLESQPAPVYAELDDEEPVCMRRLFPAYDEVPEEQDWSVDRLLLSAEMREMTELVLESCVHNLLAESLSETSDLAALGKSYYRLRH